MFLKFPKGVISMNDTSHYGKCREILHKIERHNTARNAVSIIFLIINFWYVMIVMTEHSGILTAVFGVIYTIQITIALLFSTPEHPKICIVSAFLTVFGMISEWLIPSFGILFLIFLIIIIPDRKNLNWVKEQSGYPYFSEYLDEKLQNSEKGYQPEQLPESVSGENMPELSDIPPVKKFTGTRTGFHMPELSERTDFHE